MGRPDDNIIEQEVTELPEALKTTPLTDDQKKVTSKICDALQTHSEKIRNATTLGDLQTAMIEFSNGLEEHESEFMDIFPDIDTDIDDLENHKSYVNGLDGQ